jgi:hypothetical protein
MEHHLRKRTLLLAATLTGGLLTTLPMATANAAPSGLSGDFNGDGYRDVAVSAPIAPVGGKSGAGYVAVVYGTASGLDTTKRQIISQATEGIPGVPESSDYFGSAVRLTDVNRDGRAELVASARGENTGDGTVWVLKSTTSGITATGSKSFGAATVGGPTGDAYFGDVLAG